MRTLTGPTLAMDDRARPPLSSCPRCSNATAVVGPGADAADNPPRAARQRPRRGELGARTVEPGGARDLDIVGHELGCAARIEEKVEKRVGSR